MRFAWRIAPAWPEPCQSRVTVLDTMMPKVKTPVNPYPILRNWHRLAHGWPFLIASESVDRTREGSGPYWEFKIYGHVRDLRNARAIAGHDDILGMAKLLRSLIYLISLVYFVAAASSWSFEDAVVAVGPKGKDATLSYS